MSFVEHYIGSFQFLNLVAPPDFTKESVMIQVREGVDGALLKTTGRRGQPQRWVSTVDVPALSAAPYLFNEYLTLIGADPVPIVWASIPLEGQLFAVLDVRPILMKRVIGSVGGLNAPSLAILECEWFLFPIQTS